MCLFRRSGPAGWKAHYGNEESSLPGITSVPTISFHAFPAQCLVSLRLRAVPGRAAWSAGTTRSLKYLLNHDCLGQACESA